MKATRHQNKETAMSKFVVVTTNKNRRGVFGGILESWDDKRRIAVLSAAQMAVYWSADVRGVLGLAATGPSEGCRISPVVPRIELDGVTAVMDGTNAAREAWRAQPWGD